MGKPIVYTSGEVINQETGVIFLEEIAPRIKQYGKYIYKYRRANFLCPCGNIFPAEISDVKTRGSKCILCARKKASDTHRKYLENSCINQHGTLLIKRWRDDKGRNQGIFECGECHKIFQSVLDDVLRGSGKCSDCGRRERVEATRKYKPGMYISNSFGQRFWYIENIQEEESIRYKKGIFQEVDSENNPIGEIFSANLYSVVYGSCCGKHQSRANLLFGNILRTMNIPYIPEKTFDDLVGDNNYPLRYDFYIEKKKDIILIELDGEQHFHSIDFFGGENQFLQTKKYDKIKDDYALQHGYILIRIPYFDFSKINKEYVQELLCNYNQKLGGV